MTGHQSPTGLPILLLLAGISLAAGGCLEIETNTRVNDDGSVDRTLAFRGDSSSIPQGEAMYGINSSWRVSPPDTAGGKITVTASRHFSTGVELAAALKGVPGKTIDIRPTVERHFNWFFTTYRYAETKFRSPIIFRNGNLTLSQHTSSSRNRLRRRGTAWLQRMPVIATSDGRSGTSLRLSTGLFGAASDYSGTRQCGISRWTRGRRSSSRSRGILTMEAGAYRTLRPRMTVSSEHAGCRQRSGQTAIPSSHSVSGRNSKRP
jgi:hypothetical protein